MQSTSPVDSENFGPYFVDKKVHQESPADKKDKGGMAGIVKGIKALLGDVEMAPYTVVRQQEGFEERLYPARKWARTSMSGPEKEPLATAMFRKLFSYISGRNERNMRMDMTTPVTTCIEPGAGPTCSSTFTMAFFIPQEHQTSPPAGGADVAIEERPEMTVFTRRFGGYASDEIVAKEARELAERIQAAGEADVDVTRYYTAGYDPPFKPIGRRNEVWFVKKPCTASPPAAAPATVPHTESCTAPAAVTLSRTESFTASTLATVPDTASACTPVSVPAPDEQE